MIKLQPTLALPYKILSQQTHNITTKTTLSQTFRSILWCSICCQISKAQLLHGHPNRPHYTSGPSIHPSVCSVQATNSKTKRCRKNYVPQGSNNQCAIF